MKKALIVLMLAVLALSFVGTVIAKPTCDKLPCLVEVFPDGSKYICCVYSYSHGVCTIVESACYWE